MKWLKRIAIALAVLLLVLAAGLWWLLGTAGGLRFALDRAQGFTDGALSVQQAQGRLVGPLDLAGLRYDDGHGTVAKVARAHLDLRAWPLLARRLHVLDLDVDGVEVALPKSPPETPPGEGGFSLEPPVALVLDRVRVGAVAIRQDGQPLFASDRLDLAGSWTRAGIEVKQLALRAPDGHADLAGTLGIRRGYRGDGKAGFAWTIAGVDYAGELAAHSDGRQAHADLKLTLPTPAQLQLDLAQGGDYAWQAKLDAPRFDPKPLLGDSALTALGAALQGRGDRHGGTLEGRLDLNAYPLQLKPLAARLSDDGKTLTLDRLELTSPQVRGTLSAHGTVQLAAQPVQGDLAVAWKDLRLPPELAGQDLASQGSLTARGSAERFHAEGDVDLGPPGRLAKLVLNLDGTPQQIALHTLELKQPQGGLTAQGTLALQPELGWQLDAKASRLDPGQLLAGWNGALDLALHTEGRLPQQGPDATLELRQLGGSLRGRKLDGRGRLHLTPARVLDGQLALASGGSRVQLAGKPGARNDIALTLAIASLADWLPDAAGRLDGQFRVGGLWPALAVNGRLQGSALAYQGQKVGRLGLTADVPDVSHPGGKLDLEAGAVEAGGLAFQRLALRGQGTAASHRLSLDARGTPLSAELALTGALKGQAWSGTLSTLNLDVQNLPRWRLQKPSQLSYADGAMSLSELCLTAGEPLLCAAARQDKAGNLDASYRLHQLPLALLASAAGPASMPVRAEGTLEGSGSLRRNAAGALSGATSIRSASGSVTYVEHPDRPLLGYRDLALDADLSPSRQHATVRAALSDGGSLDGQLALNGAQQALDGQLSLRLNSLAFIELFTAEVANVKGDLQGQFRIQGTLAQPAVTGQAAVSGFAAEVPAAGLKLDQGRLTVATADAREFRIQGSVQSGQGQLAVNGTAGLGEGATSSLAIQGSRFTAVDIPAAKVVVSPDLVVKQGGSGIDVGGSVALDSADVNVEKLPGNNATQASPDVVVMDAPQQEQAAASLPIRAQVKVDLGRHTHLVGFGLDGHLGGTLTVIEQPGRATTGQGQIAVDGTYKAYGQNLHIERGQLLFASTPIDNPGLSIRAVRKLNPNATIDEGQQVGLLVSGTAERPVLTVFSNPVMEQSDALAYLITGSPLSQVNSGEGQMVSAAAQALGSAAGNLLAKSIGSRIGVDEIGVSSNDALGTSAFTVGKYLSPRLYLSYGVGLFEPGQVVTLRYRLSRRWNFEAQSATNFSRASLNYRIER
ncbi:translocation/assembly module TamB domain-containing protein [Frateuria defendens]|uniref:translocation/assembly module TamB domain-containing protein n=1 Tax=Frateuria defendens TaxID=2219559 RepID=UPI00066FCA14|nr:translocation/assembly module TamB domain-containing protein [Frateuria defendens]